MMKKTLLTILSVTMIILVIVSSCGNDNSDGVSPDDDISDNVATPISAFEEFNSSSVTVSFDGDEITIQSNALPNHTSPYWPESNDLYVDPIVAVTSEISPGTIQEGSYSLTVSAAPGFAANTTATGLGAIGISVTGVPIYNGSEGPTDVTAGVASGMDWAGGHNGPTGYHYHLEASNVEENNGTISHDDHQLVGIMSDGFLLYGRRDSENGDYPDDLDESGGHFGTTQHSDEPFYHYHVVNEIYLNQYYLLFGFVDLKGTPSVIL